jgi:hypothetical protein
VATASGGRGASGGAELARRLMALRGVRIPCFMQDRPLARGRCRKIVLAALQDGPKTVGEVGELLQAHAPGISARSAANRAYHALLRLEKAGQVRCEAGVWLAP